ncbi:hypothetical protein THIX_20516 [Thiomonas sp. X19]|uniref:hypothetical protein n=1 Tax=Thiomonas sp. X19 TaxID=1050370 RepID=UPI000B684FD1|nr:hypothetical protein [Thiomonas sp. X19]SCC92466.1 hypothetical protein THIX_20516 [Thiomonas sp. X19]
MSLDEYLQLLLEDSYIIDEALIVGPYVTSGFFRHLSEIGGEKGKAYPRSKLAILADDGWDQQQLDSIKELYETSKNTNREIKIFRASPRNKSGLVHAKIYFLTLRNKSKTYTKRILLLGSANASEQGFGLHAESLINIDIGSLDQKSKSGLLSYLNQLQGGNDTPQLSVKIGRGSWIALPEIKVSSQVSYSGFDAWLRRGRLCHKYQSETSFGRLFVKLEKPFPPNQLEKPFIDNGLSSETDTQVFSRRYINENLEEVDEEKSPRWRGQYFVETLYGHWTSSECFEDLESHFVGVNPETRKKVVNAIAEASDADRNAWLERFSDAIKNATETIQNPEDLKIYFKVTKDGDVNLSHYRKNAKNKLQSDISLAQSANFNQRYISGYSFPRLPSLGEEHEDFALDWCASILNKLKRQRVTNKIVLKIREALDGETPQSASELLDKLRTEWDGSFHSSLVKFYLEDDNFSDT